MEKNNNWKTGFVIVLIILGILLIIGFPYKEKVKITKVYTMFDQVEEGGDFKVSYCKKINFPVETIEVYWSTSHPHSKCLTYEAYYEDRIWRVGETICHSNTFKVNENLSFDCFKEIDVNVRIMAKGLMDEKSTNIIIIPKNSKYCDVCKEKCEMI